MASGKKEFSNPLFHIRSPYTFVHMISPDDALQLVLKNTKCRKTTRQRIDLVHHGVLGEHVKSPIDSPPFASSSMDGYAVRFDDVAQFKTFVVQGENMAGHDSGLSLIKGGAIRIYTGAMLPRGADTIVIQENVKVTSKGITISNPSIVQRNAYIREQGQQIKKNKVALTKGHVLTPASVGYLASLGISHIKVIAPPRIAILTTGDELQLPGKKLKPAQIYESNSYTLQALLRQMHLEKFSISRVKDDPVKLYAAFKKALRHEDMLIITGGVSVGEYDFVAHTLERIGVKKVFHAIAQKPGKPMYFGMWKDKPVFALPGNPASVMVCFYEYIYPALRKMMGYQQFTLPSRELISKNDYTKKPGLTHFLKGYADGDLVHILPGQDSFLLHSFAQANCLVVLPGDSTGIIENEKVQVHLIHHV